MDDQIPTSGVGSVDSGPRKPGDPESERREERAGLRAKVIRASFWTFGSGYLRQGVRLAANLVLTRILYPEAFGLMSLVMVFFQGLQLFSDIGIGPSIIQNKRGAESAFLNTAWTVQIIRGFVLWAAGIGLAGGLRLLQSSGSLGTESTYGNADLPLLLGVISVNAAIAGFSSTALHTLNRRLALGKLTLFEIATQLVQVGSTIVLAILTRSVWALVGGTIIGTLVRAAASHRLVPSLSHRLAWDREALRDLVGFGRWIFLGTAFGFLATKGDRLVFGAIMTEGVLGVFSIAALLARFVGRMMARVDQRVMFPAYSRLVEDGAPRFRMKVRKVRLAMLGIRTPFLAALTIFGEDIIGIMYDDRYVGAGPMLRIVMVGVVVTPLTPFQGILLSAGDSFRSTLVSGTRMVLKLGCVITGYLVGGTTGALVGFAAVDTLLYPVATWAVRRYGGWFPKMDLLQSGTGVAIVALAQLYQPIF